MPLAACRAGLAPQPQTGRPAVQPVTLQLWTFPVTHANYFRELAPLWKEKSGITVEVTQVVSDPGGQSWGDKYQVAIAGGTPPDIADVEQGTFGRFLRGEVPFVDLGPRLKQEGFWDKLITSRQALYTWQGKVYGVEHALTPVVLYYRKDLFDRAGLEISRIRTWDDYVDVGKRLAGEEIQLHMYGFDVALRQRGSDYFDAQGTLVADQPLGIETLEFLAEMALTHQVINRPLPQGMDFWAAVVAGRYATYVNADWGAGFLKQFAPQTNGLWRARALPVWSKDRPPRRTSCVGGTGNCIVKLTKYEAQAWETVKFYMLDPQNAVRRYEMINLFPPLKEAFTDPRLHVAEEFFGGQDLGQLFQEVAPEVPPQYQHPLRPEVNRILGQAVSAALRGERPARDALRAAAEEARALRIREGF